MCQNWNDGLEVFEPFIETMNDLVVTNEFIVLTTRITTLKN